MLSIFPPNPTNAAMDNVLSPEMADRLYSLWPLPLMLGVLLSTPLPMKRTAMSPVPVYSVRSNSMVYSTPPSNANGWRNELAALPVANSAVPADQTQPPLVMVQLLRFASNVPLMIDVLGGGGGAPGG